MDQWLVYILSGDRYYIGSTNNLERRLEEHLRGAHIQQEEFENDCCIDIYNVHQNKKQEILKD